MNISNDNRFLYILEKNHNKIYVIGQKAFINDNKGTKKDIKKDSNKSL